MTDFSKTNWAKEEFGREYLDKADIYVVERRRMFAVLKSFVRYFVISSGGSKFLDLGCGDGIISQELLTDYPSLEITLVDGSQEMLERARIRLRQFNNNTFLKSSFQEIIGQDILEPGYDMVFSSMAIHHLTTAEKSQLFEKIYSLLVPGGSFVNIEVVLPPTGPLDGWYMKLWEDWMDEKKASLGIEFEPSGIVIARYKDLKENKPDTLEMQLNILREIGFRSVDCFYKYGIFAVYGGRK